MSASRPIQLRVNGNDREIHGKTSDTLLQVLRDKLELTGAKRGCDQGVCGACTVLVDGRPRRACLSLAVNCEGSEITTVEGLGRNGALSDVQQAFVDTGAVQCGFCSPGMVLAATALLAETPSPDVEEIRTALSGNLCRCSGYEKIITAVQSVNGTTPKENELQVHAVGQRAPRIEAGDKVAGAAKYVDDLSAPHMLHGAILGSTIPHGSIVRINTDRARALEGVEVVLTGEDFPRKYGSFVKDERVLARGKVRYAGQPVAAVAAIDVDTARRALLLIDIEYDELPAVTETADALAGDAPLIHDGFAEYEKLNLRGANLDAPDQETGQGDDNILWRVDISEGDVDTAWAECDVIVENEFETHAQQHVYMEPCGALVEIDGRGKLTIHSPSQSVHNVQAKVAEALGLPMSQVRAVSPFVGGAFGGKGGPHVQPITAALALAAGRPVKLVLSRSEDFEFLRSRHPSRYRAKTGARRDGTILAREIEAVFDAGAYCDETPAVMCFGVFAARGPYNIPNFRGSGVAVYTNKLRTGSFRGFGGPQAAFVGESQLDELAAEIGMDPVELRIKNAMRTGDRYIGGQTVESCGYVACLEAARDAAVAAGAGNSDDAADGKLRGLGYGSSLQICGSHSTSANVYLLPDGSVALNTGVVDLGQGSDTALTQICAGALELPIESVSFAAPDTDSSPFNWKTSASRVTYTAGRAVLDATNEVKRAILDNAAEMMECAVDDLELRPGGRVGLKGVAQQEVGFREISARAHYRVGGPIIGARSLMFDGEKLDPKRALLDGFVFDNFGIYIFGAHAVEIELDQKTGRVDVLRAWCAHDVGRAINPGAVEGQIEGGFVQGLGYALFEEMVWADGRLINPTLMDYKIPGIADIPVEIHSIIIEDPEPTGPFGAKGIGEPGLVPVAPAIANAIHAATGVRITKLPLTPERVLDALETSQ